jgi:16S rRNA (adenine1518-N6/adenine1519-N6)-dimethyltransferase
VIDRGLFRRIVREGFGQRRKMLRNALGAFLSERFSGSKPEEILESCGIDGRRRAETLSVAEWAGLADGLARMGKETS